MNTPYFKLIEEIISEKSMITSSQQLNTLLGFTNDLAIFHKILAKLNHLLYLHSQCYMKIYKSLVIAEHLMVFGNADVANTIIKNIAIKTKELTNFQHMSKGKDCGISIREKAKRICMLIEDESIFSDERDKGKVLRDKMYGKENKTHNDTEINFKDNTDSTEKKEEKAKEPPKITPEIKQPISQLKPLPFLPKPAEAKPIDSTFDFLQFDTPEKPTKSATNEMEFGEFQDANH